MTHDDKSAKLNDLDSRIEKLRQDSGLVREDDIERATGPKGYGAGVQVGIELIAGTLMGGFIGYWLDRWLGTWPIIFMVMFFAGAGAGILNAYRYIDRLNKDTKPPEGDH